jgi:hypothetical protein
MRYMFRGDFSQGLFTVTTMGVTFSGRTPSEVTDLAAANWFDGHPDYVRVAEEPAPEVPRPRIMSHPLDHDKNGKKGGSLPRKRKKKVAKA